MEQNLNAEIVKEIFNRKIGIIGVGQMGTALLLAFSQYLKKNNMNDFNQIFYLCDSFEKKGEEMKTFGYKNFTTEEKEIFSKTNIIFICVKPDQIEGLLTRNQSFMNKNTLLVSIAAGISIEYMEKTLAVSNNEMIPKIIRIMTNHLCMILEAGSVYSTNSSCNSMDERIVSTLLSNVGIIKKVEEKQMNIFTALSGSGPAFVYHFTESLVDAALKNGIDVNTARDYAIQVLYGASKYMRESKEKNPNNIKYIVTTPNGTTIAGLSQLDKFRFKHAINEAITKATQRGAEIETEKMKKFASHKF